MSRALAALQQHCPIPVVAYVPQLTLGNSAQGDAELQSKVVMR
jgi:hypothetical protein